LAGDFNRSGQVDLSDYVIWRRTLGTAVGSNFLGADGNGNGVVDAGDYQVWRANYSRYVDDHANASVGATGFSVSLGSKSGKLEVGGDVDWFAFDASAGSTFDIKTTLGTLTDSAIRVIGTDGVTQLAFNDNATGLESLIQWEAPADGRYFIEVLGPGSATGTYGLSVTATGIDDHGDDSTTATQVAVPNTTAGNIEVVSDVDWFKFTAASGTNYTFETTLGTLLDSTIEIIGTNGTTQLAFDDDSGVGLGSRVEWIAPSNGIYFVVVKGFSGAFGTYTLNGFGTAPGSGSLAFSMAAGSSELESTFVTDTAGESALTNSVSGSTLAAGAFDFGTAGISPRTAKAGTVQSTAGSTSSERQDSALVAWLQSLAAGKLESSSGDSPIGAFEYGQDEGDLFGDTDAIFDELGSAAIEAGCAV
jgi:hypothetical protein